MNKEVLAKNFNHHGFQTSFFETAKEATAYLKEKIKGKTIALGGSVTTRDMGLYDVLSEENIVLWHWKVAGKETLDLAKNASIYITSANGVSQTGELVNIDGTGNRVAMTLYGPQKVYFVVGSNKITPDLQSAITRAKNIAAPKNAQRFGLSTPCAAKADKCYNCNSPQRICKGTVILERPMGKMEVEIVLIEETLGF